MSLAFAILKRSLSTTSAMNAIQNVTIIGGGLMGSGIAQVAAQTGHNVTVTDVSNEILKETDARIQESLGRVAKKLHQGNREDCEKFVKESKNNIKMTTDTAEAVHNADLIVEAVVERLDVKHKLFKKLDEIAPEKTIFASNTSSLSITDIASVTKRQDRFGGLHFFNPVAVMQLLEVIRIPETSEETYKAMMEWGKAIGKVCVTCKDTPGFIVNRLLIPYMAEAARMFDSGIASAKDIDIAMKLGANYPMGPLELIDYTGVDLAAFVIKGWHEKFPDHPAFFPIGIIDKLNKEGKFGVKSGEGFYKYK